MILGIECPSELLWSDQEMSLLLMNCVSWLTVQRMEHVDSGVVVGRRLIGRSAKWHFVVLS